MKKMKGILSLVLVAALMLGLVACGTSTSETTTNENSASQAIDDGAQQGPEASQGQSADTTVITADSDEKADIEGALDLANIKPEPISPAG